MEKIRCTCSVCSNEKGGMCSVKNIGIHVNKHRWCSEFVQDMSKVKLHTHGPKTVMRPDSMYDKSTRERRSRKHDSKLFSVGTTAPLINKNPDCLARLREDLKDEG